MFGRIKKALAPAAAFLLAGVGSSQAALDLALVDVDMTNTEAMALKVITALCVLWGIRKVVKFLNRS